MSKKRLQQRSFFNDYDIDDVVVLNDFAYKEFKIKKGIPIKIIDVKYDTSKYQDFYLVEPSEKSFWWIPVRYIKGLYKDFANPLELVGSMVFDKKINDIV